MSTFNSVIREFMLHYTLKYDYYSLLAQMVEERLRGELDRRGIRAIVTSRAKDAERLQAKLIQRDTRKADPKHYKTLEDIEADIVDFSGARVALYFPGDMEKVSTLINEVFNRLELKRFPEPSSKVRSKGMAGYIAEHHRVRLKEESLTPSQQRYAAGRVEIQVASVLMHAWSEVEHDLQYKPLSGKLSLEEETTLDELNGLVLAGEIALERLQRSLVSRSSAADFKFETTFDIQDFLSQTFPQYEANSTGRLNYLLLLLKFAGLDRPESLRPYVDKVDKAARVPVADQLIDLITDEDPEKSRFLQTAFENSVTADREKESHEVNLALARFLNEWISLERTLREKSGTLAPAWLMSSSLLAGLELDEDTINDFHRVRRIRNALFHGQLTLPAAELNRATEAVSNLRAKVDVIKPLKTKKKPPFLNPKKATKRVVS